MQTTQNKCIRFCLGLPNRAHVGNYEFKKVNWLPVEERLKQCFALGAFKYWKDIAPDYMSEIYSPVFNNYNTRRSKMALSKPLTKTNWGQKAISFLGPDIWNGVDNDLQELNSICSFKHAFKKRFFHII